MTQKFSYRDIISMQDFTKEDILTILDCAKKFKKTPQPALLKGFLLGSCFFEPSTRTRLSFEAAMKRLGGEVIGFSEATHTSTAKGETLSDMIKVLGTYVDVIVLRHPQEGAALLAAEATEKPIINGGDGANQHPTQALTDLFTIRECQGRLEELHIAWVGDLKYGRAVHSLVQACALFQTHMYFVATSSFFELPKQLCEELKKHRILFSFHSSLESIMPKLDILYMTRIQKERLKNGTTTEMRKPEHILSHALLSQAKPNLKILHPLPRLSEIDPTIDNTPYAHYFQQAHNGLFVRQALLSLVLEKGGL